VPNAIVDPEELRSFTSELKRFNTEVQSEVASVQRRWARLGESWQDGEHAKFADLFGKILATHARLVDAAEKQIPLLFRKAQRIQEYLGPQTSSMGQNTARISSPDAIRDFRGHFLKFEQRSKQAVSGVRSDCDGVMEWLRRDQQQYWKQELRKIEEVVRQARSAYILARHSSEYLRKPSYQEEEKALKKAEHYKQEVEMKLEAVKKWAIVLEQQAKKLMGPINNLAGILESSAPTARARLDHMVESLEEYLRESPGDAGTP